jgi:hypothetical protein
MVVVKEVKFSEDEYKTIAKAAELIGTWRDDNDGYELDRLMAKLVNDTYGTTRPSPDVDGWLEFMRTMLDVLADYMDEHDED